MSSINIQDTKSDTLPMTLLMVIAVKGSTFGGAGFVSSIFSILSLKIGTVTEASCNSHEHASAVLLLWPSLATSGEDLAARGLSRECHAWTSKKPGRRSSPGKSR